MEWKAVGGALLTIHAAIQWWIGDWLNYGEREYRRQYDDAMKETGYAYQTLANLKRVSACFEFSRRREDLSWSHHEVVAGLEPATQAAWLDRAAQGGWSVRELRSRVAGHRYSGSERPDPDGGATVPPEETASQELADYLAESARVQVTRSEAQIERRTAEKAALGNVARRKRKNALIREHRATAEAAKEEERRVRSQVALLGLPDIPQDFEQAKSVLPIFRGVRARIVTALDDDPDGPVTLLEDPKLSEYPALHRYVAEFFRVVDTLLRILLSQTAPVVDESRRAEETSP